MPTKAALDPTPLTALPLPKGKPPARKVAAPLIIEAATMVLASTAA